jgi:hypothetical protein
MPAFDTPDEWSGYEGKLSYQRVRERSEDLPPQPRADEVRIRGERVRVKVSKRLGPISLALGEQLLPQCVTPLPTIKA